jgi:hypothetical protein
MTFHDYLLKNLEQTAMISLSVDSGEPFQYNYWNWFHSNGQFHLLKDDYSIGHIIHSGVVSKQDDGSIVLQSEYYPKRCVLNFYFGGAKF